MAGQENDRVTSDYRALLIMRDNALGDGNVNEAARLEALASAAYRKSQQIKGRNDTRGWDILKRQSGA